MSAIITNRAAAKARARERDEERLRRGEISPSELQRENLVFRGFRKDVIGLKPKYKPNDVDYVLGPPRT
ncbi:hypothetical protein [Gemmobacter sp.]|uniref:hypothetical protein n=1 Tax=Gemmobacter sp. TaxID=1898957 RepID=UPI002AFFCC5D|nr:hypothetical protein [Gemmobacter sp.]